MDKVFERCTLLFSYFISTPRCAPYKKRDPDQEENTAKDDVCLFIGFGVGGETESHNKGEDAEHHNTDGHRNA